jgi:hypothetical protein
MSTEHVFGSWHSTAKGGKMLNGHVLTFFLFTNKEKKNVIDPKSLH